MTSAKGVGPLLPTQSVYDSRNLKATSLGNNCVKLWARRKERDSSLASINVTCVTISPLLPGQATRKPDRRLLAETCCCAATSTWGSLHGSWELQGINTPKKKK